MYIYIYIYIIYIYIYAYIKHIYSRFLDIYYICILHIYVYVYTFMNTHKLHKKHTNCSYLNKSR